MMKKFFVTWWPLLALLSLVWPLWLASRADAATYYYGASVGASGPSGPTGATGPTGPSGPSGSGTLGGVSTTGLGTSNPGDTWASARLEAISTTNNDTVSLWRNPAACTASTMRVVLRNHVAVGPTPTRTFTLLVNGSDTALTCTITGDNTECSDLTHTVSIAAGDLVSWHEAHVGLLVSSGNWSISALCQ